MTSICTICGKSITHKPSKHPKFCSRECKTKSQCVKKGYTIQFDNEEIKRLYLEEKLSTLEIAEIMGTYKKMIRQRLLDMGIQLRSSGESKRLFLIKYPEQNPNNLPGVKEKQIQAQIEYCKKNADKLKQRNNLASIGMQNRSPEEIEQWKNKCSQAKLNMTPQQKYDALVKQFNTKKKNGTNLCNGLESIYEQYLIDHDIEYEVQFMIPTGIRRFRYDFYIPSTNTIVEVNGTGTHADPRKYIPDEIVKLGLPGWTPRPAKDIWKDDELKHEYAKEHGYLVEVIWEKDLI